MSTVPTGRIQYCSGVRYYSPNSLVDSPLSISPAVSRTLESNPFKPGQTGYARVRYQDFTCPCQWSPAFAWISFIPVIPSQWYADPHSHLGRVLSQLPPLLPCLDSSGAVCGFQVPSDCAWVHLESNLYGAVVALSHHYNILCILPFLPNAIGYRSVFTHRKQLKRRLEQAREWFLVWFGAFSFLVATLRNPWRGGLSPQFDHQWCAVLRSRGIPTSFVDGLQHSLAVDTRPSVRRAGIIVDIYTPPHNQPHPSWFVAQGVPVWYRWSDVEELLSRKSLPYLELRPASPLLDVQGIASATVPAPESTHGEASTPPSPSTDLARPSLAPPADGPSLPSALTSESRLVHQAPPAFPPNPSLTPPPRTDSRPSVGAKLDSCAPDAAPDWLRPLADSPGPRTAMDHIHRAPPEPEWVEFFKTREETSRRLLLVETQKARQMRESRMRTPATTSAKVFEWYPSPQEGVGYERFPVLAKARVDTLEQYSESQKRYDPVFNEWDCCSAWGPDDNEDGWSGSEDFAPVPPAAASALRPVERPPPPPLLSYAQSETPPDLFANAEGSPPYESLFDDVVEAFGNFYGFTHVVDGFEPHPTEAYTARDRVFFLRVVGLDSDSVPHDDYGYYRSTHYCLAHEFLKSLCSRQPPQRLVSWDISDECLHPVRLSPRFKHIHVVQLANPGKVDAHDRTEQYYLVNNPADPTPWKLAVTTAAHATLVCRRPADHTAVELAVFLVQHGVPF